MLKIGTPKVITVILLKMEQFDFSMQYCVQKMHCLHCLLRPICPNTINYYGNKQDVFLRNGIQYFNTKLPVLG